MKFPWLCKVLRAKWKEQNREGTDEIENLSRSRGYWTNENIVIIYELIEKQVKIKHLNFKKKILYSQYHFWKRILANFYGLFPNQWFLYLELVLTFQINSLFLPLLWAGWILILHWVTEICLCQPLQEHVLGGRGAI